MMEEASENRIAGQDATRAHRLVDSPCHFEHTVAVAGINDQVEDLSIGQADTFGFKLAYDL